MAQSTLQLLSLVPRMQSLVKACFSQYLPEGPLLMITLRNVQTGETRYLEWRVHTNELFTPASSVPPFELTHWVGQVLKRRLHTFLISGGVASVPELWLRVR